MSTNHGDRRFCRCLFSPTPPARPTQTNVISTGATDGLIVRCAVERSLYFAFLLLFVYVVILSEAKNPRIYKGSVATRMPFSSPEFVISTFVFRWERRALALRQDVANIKGL